MVVRQFAFKKAPVEKGHDAVRAEFAETLFWTAGEWTDDSGVFETKFQVGDSVTAFRAAADVLTRAGVLGSGDGWVSTQAPIEAEVKVCLQRGAPPPADALLGLQFSPLLLVPFFRGLLPSFVFCSLASWFAPPNPAGSRGGDSWRYGPHSSHDDYCLTGAQA